MSCFLLYMCPLALTSLAAKTIADCVHERQLSYPDAPAIVLGDLNHCHLETMLPGFEQYIKDKTRKDNILDKCVVNVKDAYVSNCKAPILNSDHNVVHMIRLNLREVNQRVKLLGHGQIIIGNNLKPVLI